MALFLEIKVVPQAGIASIALDKRGMLKVSVKSPPEDGKANRELIKLFALALSIPQDAITIVLGAESRKKRLKLDISLTYAEVMHKLGLEVQNKFM